MAYEGLAWPAEPSSTDLVDPGATYNMGIRFSLVEAKNCVGVRWRVPDSVSTPPGGTHVASIWTTTSETRIGTKDFTPTVGGYQDILFDTPIALSAGTIYVAAVHTQHYVFRASGGVFPSSPSGNVVSDESRLASSDVAETYPASAGSALYYVSPLIETSAGPTPVAPDSLSITVTLGEPTIGYGLDARPDSLEIPLYLGAPGSQSGEDTTETGNGSSSGWWSLKGILDEARENLREEREPPAACPQDGEPLRDGHCRYCGEMYLR